MILFDKVSRVYNLPALPLIYMCSRKSSCCGFQFHKTWQKLPYVLHLSHRTSVHSTKIYFQFPISEYFQNNENFKDVYYYTDRIKPVTLFIS